MRFSVFETALLRQRWLRIGFLLLLAALPLQLFLLPCRNILRSAATRAIEYIAGAFLCFCVRAAFARKVDLWFLRILLWLSSVGVCESGFEAKNDSLDVNLKSLIFHSRKASS